MGRYWHHDPFSNILSLVFFPGPGSKFAWGMSGPCDGSGWGGWGHQSAAVLHVVRVVASKAMGEAGASLSDACPSLRPYLLHGALQRAESAELGGVR